MPPGVTVAPGGKRLSLSDYVTAVRRRRSLHDNFVPVSNVAKLTAARGMKHCATHDIIGTSSFYGTWATWAPAERNTIGNSNGPLLNLSALKRNAGSPWAHAGKA